MINRWMIDQWEVQISIFPWLIGSPSQWFPDFWTSKTGTVEIVLLPWMRCFSWYDTVSAQPGKSMEGSSNYPGLKMVHYQVS